MNNNSETNNQQEIRQKTQKERNIENNENNIRNAAELAKATGHPIAAAIGSGVQMADKISGGRTTRALGKKLNFANRITPGGRTAQKLLNKTSESGAADMAGKIAAKKNMSKSGPSTATDKIGNTPSDSSVGNLGSNNINNNAGNNSTDNNVNTYPESAKEESQGSITKFKSKRNTKIVILLISFFITASIFICVIIAPLMALGIIDIGDFNLSPNGNNGSSSGGNYIAISNNVEYWWPLGSSEADSNGHASGEPISCIVTSYFGYRSDPYTGQTSYHSGIDLAPSGGSYGYGEVNVIAAKSGTVTIALNDPNCESNANNESCNGSGYGNYIMIQHDDGIVTLYGHLHKDTITVKEGDIVNQGQVIAKMGSSGRSTGMHLHFEVRENGTAVDPLNFVSLDNARPISISVNSGKKENEGVKNEVS